MTEPLWSTQNTNCKVTMKFIDTQRKTSHVLTIEAPNPQQLRERMLEAEAEAIGEWGWIADQWPFVKDADERLGLHPEANDEIDIYQEFGIPATAEGLIAFIATARYTELPETVREKITGDLHTFLQTKTTAPAPVRPAASERASRLLYGVNLDGLEDADSNPLLTLPPGSSQPTFRPARWCAIHQQWMKMHSNDTGSWFSHTSTDRQTGYCKGKALKAG